MDDKLFRSWKRQVYNLEQVLKTFASKRIIAVNQTPYPKVVPAIFMPRRSYAIYSVQDSRDIEALREFVTIYSLGERHDKVAQKVKALSFLIKNYHFQAFLKSRKEPVTLLFGHISPSLLAALDDAKVAWAGYNFASCEKFLDQEQFYNLLKKYKLPHLPRAKFHKDVFLGKDYADILKMFNRPVRVVGERLGRHLPAGIVDSAQALLTLKSYITQSPDWSEVHSLWLQPELATTPCNLVACVTEKGILTSGLHLPLPDFTNLESAQDNFKYAYGYVLNDDIWPANVVIEAQVAAELIGEDLRGRGYVGVFGLEFLYEQSKQKLFVSAFIPGFPPDAVEFAQKCLLVGTPPPEFFSLAAYFNISVDFDFTAVNDAWKKPRPVSSIAFSLGLLPHMTMDLLPGWYRYNEQEKTADFLGRRFFIHQLAGEDEFLLFDAVLRPGQSIPADMRRSFKFFFRANILQSADELLPRYSAIVQNFANLIRGQKFTSKSLNINLQAKNKPADQGPGV